MRENSKKRLLINLVTALFVVLCMTIYMPVTAFAGTTQISSVKINITKNDWNQTSNPDVTASGKYSLKSVGFSKNVSNVEPGEDITITVALSSNDGYVFKDTLKKSNFTITNGTYKSHSYDSEGDLVVKITYTVRGYAKDPSNLRWNGTKATWDQSGSSKVTYSLKICKGSKSETVAEGITSTSYDLAEYLNSSDYFDKSDVTFKVKAEAKSSYSDYIKSSDWIESDEFNEWNRVDDNRNYEGNDHKERLNDDDHYKNSDDKGNRHPENTENRNYNNTGWNCESGNWYYYENGSRYRDGFKFVGNHLYYFNSNGVMCYGWTQISGKWYYIDYNNGVISNSWYYDNGTWYYLGGDGVMCTGWKQINGTWYYFESSGAMRTGWINIDGATYYLSSSGAMVTGNQYIDGTVHYFNESSGALIY